MASGEEYPEFVLDLLRDVPVFAHRKMMGEYLPYSEACFSEESTTTGSCSRTRLRPAPLSRQSKSPMRAPRPCSLSTLKTQGKPQA